jgi:hypothetical protein
MLKAEHPVNQKIFTRYGHYLPVEGTNDYSQFLVALQRDDPSLFEETIRAEVTPLEETTIPQQTRTARAEEFLTDAAHKAFYRRGAKPGSLPDAHKVRYWIAAGLTAVAVIGVGITTGLDAQKRRRLELASMIDVVPEVTVDILPRQSLAQVSLESPANPTTLAPPESTIQQGNTHPGSPLDVSTVRLDEPFLQDMPPVTGSSPSIGNTPEEAPPPTSKMVTTQPVASHVRTQAQVPPTSHVIGTSSTESALIASGSQTSRLLSVSDQGDRNILQANEAAQQTEAASSPALEPTLGEPLTMQDDVPVLPAFEGMDNSGLELEPSVLSFAQAQEAVQLNEPAQPSEGTTPASLEAAVQRFYERYPMFAPGQIVSVRLVTGIVLYDGATVPVVAEGLDQYCALPVACPPTLFRGEAVLGGADYVEIKFDRVFVNEEMATFSGFGMDSSNNTAIRGTIVQRAPAAAQDMVRAALGGVSDYVNALTRQRRVTIVDGQAVTETTAPDLGTFIGSAAASVFALPQETTSVIRVVEIPAGQAVKVYIDSY